MRESTIENKLKKAVESVGGLCPKWVSPGRRGVPDRICIFPDGVIVFAEVKKPGGRLHPLQKKYIGLLEERGHHVIVVDSDEKIQEVIDLWNSSRINTKSLPFEKS